MRVTVDRFEGDYAVCERDDRKMMNIEKMKLPKGVREGDVLVLDGPKIFIDEEETKRRKEEIENLWCQPSDK